MLRTDLSGVGWFSWSIPGRIVATAYRFTILHATIQLCLRHFSHERWMQIEEKKRIRMWIFFSPPPFNNCVPSPSFRFIKDSGKKKNTSENRKTKQFYFCSPPRLFPLICLCEQRRTKQQRSWLNGGTVCLCIHDKHEYKRLRCDHNNV